MLTTTEILSALASLDEPASRPIPIDRAIYPNSAIAAALSEVGQDRIEFTDLDGTLCLTATGPLGQRRQTIGQFLNRLVELSLKTQEP
jgi:hypothetical protein